MEEPCAHACGYPSNFTPVDPAVAGGHGYMTFEIKVKTSIERDDWASGLRVPVARTIGDNDET